MDDLISRKALLEELDKWINPCVNYAWLAGQMGIPVNECHFGYFNLTQLLQAYKILQSIKDLPMRYDNCGNCFFKEADHDTGRTTIGDSGFLG